MSALKSSLTVRYHAPCNPVNRSHGAFGVMFDTTKGASVVWASQSLVILWRGGCTFGLFERQGGSLGKEVSCFSTQDAPASVEEAKKFARWWAEQENL